MKITIKDVAKEAGVSIGTVDRALNNRGRISDTTKEEVMKAVKKWDIAETNLPALSAKMLKQKFL